jgi:hypothetical protein
MLAIGHDILQDIIFQVDGGLGAANGGEHGGKSLLAVDQQARGVSRHQRRFRHRFLDRQMALEDAGIARFGRNPVQQGAALLGG